MKVTYQSKNYTPDAVLKRYVRFCTYSGLFEFCEVGGNHLDLRQGTVERGELPEQIAEAAIAHEAVSMSYVDWPL